MNYYQRMSIAGRNITIYLPPSYENSGEHYPVAYVQDGGQLFDDCLNQLEHLYRQRKLKELILIGVEPHNRNEEYTPWPAKALLESYPAFGGGGRAYVDEVADVLKPFIDGQYRTKPEAAYTAFIGGSFGGLISMFAGYWRPETFGKLGLLSTSFWYEGAMDFIREEPPLADPIRIFMSVGSCEGIYKGTLQKDMVGNTLEAHAMWLEKGIPFERLHLAIEDGGTHDAHFMALRFTEALIWLFRDEGDASVPAVEQEAAAGRLAGIGGMEQTEEPMKPLVPTESMKQMKPVESIESMESVKVKEPMEQTKPTAPVEVVDFTITGTRQWIMHAGGTGRRTYRIMIYVPDGLAPEGGYPVIYTLDGNATFGSLTEAMRLQSRPPHGFRPSMIVGIGYDSNAPIVTDRRFYDFTEPTDPSSLPLRPDGSEWPETGGAEAFLAFIEEELKPVIERHYPIDRRRQSLFGHSLGGLFALNVLFKRPEAFQTYIAGSPSVWWSNRRLLEQLPGLETRLKQGGGEPALFIGIGSEEKPAMIEDARLLYRQLLPYQAYGLRLGYRLFEDEGHVSVIPPLISRMLRFIAQQEGR
ncbi:alpha/beta hydrolase [Paenibacillus oenotherae]|uniref:Alpha/beta hydrolase n=1 Tax=Paenibacillus oenotherae TaxID=1435645 RepID=A0ABS7D6R3_9BACL|nr:alpha/beta hydrolase-fold protein [Paenibacillus oenotherae]MBW7475468.1 alpha/beta hydrolase [Paenibacillus oenotherae]